MKKMAVFTIVVLLTSATAVADSAYVDPALLPSEGAQAVTTVSSAKRAYDNQWVTLQGRLHHKWGEHYTLTDSTGSIEVEIDDMPVLQIPPGAVVRVMGEIDREGGPGNFGWVKVEGKRVQLVRSGNGAMPKKSKGAPPVAVDPALIDPN